MLDAIKVRENVYERDLEFIAMIASGSRYEEIARLKNVSVTTVRMSLYKVRDSVGATSVAQMVAIVHAAGLLVYMGEGSFKPNVLPENGST